MLNEENGAFRSKLFWMTASPTYVRSAGQLREIIRDREPRSLAGDVNVKFRLGARIVIQRAERQAIVIRVIVELAQDRRPTYPAKNPCDFLETIRKR